MDPISLLSTIFSPSCSSRSLLATTRSTDYYPSGRIGVPATEDLLKSTVSNPNHPKLAWTIIPEGIKVYVTFRIDLKPFQRALYMSSDTWRFLCPNTPENVILRFC